MKNARVSAYVHCWLDSSSHACTTNNRRRDCHHVLRSAFPRGTLVSRLHKRLGHDNHRAEILRSSSGSQALHPPPIGGSQDYMPLLSISSAWRIEMHSFSISPSVFLSGP